MGDIYRRNIDYYERNAERYEDSSWYFFNKYKDNTLQEELRHCVDLLKKGHLEVLEIGPGTGYLLSKLITMKNLSLNYLGIEHSSEMTKILMNRYRNKVQHIEILNASVSADYIAGHLKGRTFDLIIGSSILHHLPDYDSVIKQLSGLLNHDGIMYFLREPIHKNECLEPTIWQRRANHVYAYMNALFLKPGIKKILWPRKVKQEDTKDIAVHMFKEGISVKPFQDLCKNSFRLILFRKYNRRATSFFSYLENKWLPWSRMDIFGNTLFAIGIQKKGRPE